MTAELLTDERSHFDRFGYISPIRVRTPTEAAAITQQWDQVEEREQLPQEERFLMYNRHRDLDFLMDIASDERVLDIVESLIGPDILLFGTRLICKWPGDVDFVPWHQDVSVRNQLTPPEQVTGWYAVDNVTTDNGCVQVIPGSHHDGMLTREPANHAGSLLRHNEETPVSEERRCDALPIELQAGEMSLHHGFTLHTSGPNPSTERRCGYVIRYVPAYVQQGDDVEVNQRETAILLRGVDPFSESLTA